MVALQDDDGRIPDTKRIEPGKEAVQLPRQAPELLAIQLEPALAAGGRVFQALWRTRAHAIQTIPHSLVHSALGVVLVGVMRHQEMGEEQLATGAERRLVLDACEHFADGRSHAATTPLAERGVKACGRKNRPQDLII